MVVLAAAIAVTAGGGSSLAAGTEFCPPTFDPAGTPPEFPTGTAVREGKAEDVKLETRYGPTCKPTITATAVRGTAERVEIPFQPSASLPLTAKAFRLEASDLCDVKLTKALQVTGQAHRGTCEQALLAFYVGPTPSPKEGTAVAAETCEIVGIARLSNQQTATAHREKIPVTIELSRVGGQEGLLFGDDLTVKISDPSVGTPYIAPPENPAQLKACNAK